MGFDRLLAHDRAKILLVNLAETQRRKLLPKTLRKPVLKEIHKGLAALGTRPTPEEILQVFKNVVFRSATRLQAKGVERPADDTTLAAVVSFDKVRGLLEKVLFRRPDLKSQIDAIIAPDAPDATVSKAAGIINRHSPRMSTLSLSEWGTIFWAAPTEEIDRLLSICAAGSNPMQVARFLRDSLGLIHMKFDLTHPDRHLFLFRAKASIANIVADEDFIVTRPTTLDGWDNPRFCQPLLPPAPFQDGCGMTVDIADYKCSPGAAEVVCSALPIKFFDISYLGPVDKSSFGSDSDFVDLIREGQDLNDLVDYLSALAA
jgi:hypothetical protein